jgi:acetyl-CoA/propionyl-CoA carboxylase, biotin carboxylase, biotin carboxyl carrier protein
VPPIRKLLIANRGEIAVRIARACRELGIRSVAVYSEADRDALHAEFADEAYLLGEAAPAASYLNIDRILECAAKAGADAVHPGYGFLAENGRFAAAVGSAGMVWVGPPADAIRSMGDKVEARRRAAAAGVPSVPGSDGPIDHPDAIEAFAGEHGWPVAIKATHGGGGRGFRVVRVAAEAAESFERAARESGQAFGSSELYLERYLDEPRHVEVQVLGDAHGTVLHLGERDCSLQRRHQKLVEESPSPLVDAGLRSRMGEAAVAVARAAGYRSAGTVEFLLERTDAGPCFWFLEMNTRLQVEHGVTEVTTGIDLVKAMIRVAEGEPLGLAQEDVEQRGHAIEYRINAEDATAGFLPSPGTITGYREPSGPGVRMDSGIAAGTEIPQAYDSLVAKLICWGVDREEAVARSVRALHELRIDGVRTTIPFHQWLVRQDWFRASRFSTSTVERLDLSGLPAPEPPPALPGGGAEGGGRSRSFAVELDGKRFRVRVGDESADRRKPRPPELGTGAGLGGAGETLAAPMQGTIVKTLVGQGATVKAGDGIAVLEAMKMENLILCHRDGVVGEILVKGGDTVQIGTPIAVIRPTSS